MAVAEKAAAAAAAPAAAKEEVQLHLVAVEDLPARIPSGLCHTPSLNLVSC